jgi:hypothetical protein
MEQQSHTQQLPQTEFSCASQIEQSLDAVLLMMARHLVTARRSSLAHQPVDATIRLAFVPPQEDEKFDK